jgi:hypothetical protein
MDEAPSTARKELFVVWLLKTFYTVPSHRMSWERGVRNEEEREEKAKGIL